MFDSLQLMRGNLKDQILSLPKAHLHLHLVGSARESTIIELAEEQGIHVGNLWDYHNLETLVPCYAQIMNVINQPDHLIRICRELVEDEANNGVVYLEPCINPFDYAQRFTCKPEEVLNLLTEVFRIEGEARGLDVGLMITVDRAHPYRRAVEVAKFAAEHSGDGIVAFGILGNEAVERTNSFQEPCAIAKEANLLIVPHAGETCGPESVWEAVESLKADRIAHGVRAIEDPTLLLLLASSSIPCDVCLKSNVLLNIYPDITEHPLPALIAAGVPVTINSDDKLLFMSDIVEEYHLAQNAFQLNDSELAAIARTSILYSGASKERIARTLQRIDDWEKKYSLIAG
jgi:adenosine deaminase